MESHMRKNGNVIVVTGFKGGNYGTKLQSTALCKYFEKLGYTTSILEKFSYKGYFLRHLDIGFARLLKRILSNNDTIQFFDDKEHYYYSAEREKRLNEYDAENYHAVIIETKDQYDDMVRANTTYVVGSDIIWQPAMGIPGYWFLDFIYYTKLNRFSYATSIGANELPPKYFHFYRKYLDKFTSVGVRENTAVKLLTPHTNRNVTQVIDPTLLHNVDFWDRFADAAKISVKNVVPGEYVFCYFVMHDSTYWDYIKLVNNYLISNPETVNYKIIILPMHHLDESQPYTVILDGTPYEFVYLIKHAAFIITDSFHVCAFSLNYKKEFYLLRRKRKDEDSKYDDFFERYGLTSRSIHNRCEFNRDALIDYEYAHKKLDEDRKFANDFISNALSINSFKG